MDEKSASESKYLIADSKAVVSFNFMKQFSCFKMVHQLLLDVRQGPAEVRYLLRGQCYQWNILRRDGKLKMQ